MTQNHYGNRLFDEVALKNDLDWASATAPPPSAPPIADRLRSLDALFSEGLITEDEYRSRRAAILDEI